MMAKKKELDNLDLDMIQCKADGFSYNYGKWKAWKGSPVREKKPIEIPERWQICPQCGNYFNPSNKGRQIYCQIDCQKKAQRARDRVKIREHYREYMAKRRAERKMENESCA